MSINRLFELVYLLLERGQMTASELASRFEVSVRTIYRDVDTLSAAGIPIYAIPGNGGGIALMEHFVLTRAAFSDAEQRQLLTALGSMVSPALPGAEETLHKLQGLFKCPGEDWLQVDLSRWGNSLPDTAKFESLRGAILKRHVLAFTYVGSYGGAHRRKVSPARLVFKDRAWYLQGFCWQRKAWRTFKVSRILELQVLQEEFQPLPAPPPPLEGKGMPEERCLPIRLRFSPALAYRVYDEFDEGCISREEDGSLLVSISFPEDTWLYGYLLSFGLGVEVLHPPVLQTRLAHLAQEIWQSYQKVDTGCQLSSDTLGTS